jgi:oxygen-independent coproporphyrinogen-3 oxidase
VAEGIYIHVPFCRQACRYCDFYFTVNQTKEDEFIKALLKELSERAAEFQGNEMGSLYLGGGTPSRLTTGNLKKVMERARALYSLADGAEVTIECNPDDLDPGMIEQLKTLGFNRISIGIQSFREEDLQLMRRSHGASRAQQAVEDAFAAGFENITVDLIYGIPGQTEKDWRNNLDRVLTLPVSHLSAYHLTFEPGTIFDHWRKKGRLKAVDEELSVRMYEVLRKYMVEAGFEHYEISNFSKEGKKSRHNLLYWSGEPYMGFGPSAHSYNGTRRSWNVSSLDKYIESIHSGESLAGSELLSVKDQYHDYLLTFLRTIEGVDPERILERFGREFRDHFDRKAGFFRSKGSITVKEGRWHIDPDHWLLADHIIREIFMEEP